jgi:hypothetical protein
MQEPSYVQAPILEALMSLTISDEVKKELEKHLKKHRKLDLVNAYLHMVQLQYRLSPVAYVKGKKIYLSQNNALQELEERKELWREAEVKITFGQPTVNHLTKKIYICPFSGKVFGDNTHPNPQDAIYEWVASCPENTERLNGIRVKRFYVSEDPEMIKNYITERKASITKIAYSSIATGKIFSTKEGAVEDFIHAQLRPISLPEVQSQNKYEIEADLLQLLNQHLNEDLISQFVDILSEDKKLQPYIKHWFESDEDAAAEQ